jgi:hypothetical protein
MTFLKSEMPGRRDRRERRREPDAARLRSRTLHDSHAHDHLCRPARRASGDPPVQRRTPTPSCAALRARSRPPAPPARRGQQATTCAGRLRTLGSARLRRNAANRLMRVGVPRRRSSGSAPPSSLPSDRSYTGGSAIVGTAGFRPADRLSKLRRTATHPLMRVEVPRRRSSGPAPPSSLRNSWVKTGVARSLSFERRFPTPQ